VTPAKFQADARDVIVNHASTQVDLTLADGGLRPVIGVNTVQVLRANREQPQAAEGSGWTYNHQPYLAFWNDTYYLEYLSNRVAEHEGAGQTLLATSKDGLQWNQPAVIFPPYTLPDGGGSVMHQRMGFYRTRSNRLLVLAFYGPACPYPWPPQWDMPNNGKGIGRVVREIYRDGSLSPIYFIRYNRHAGWDESNTLYPFYQSAAEAEFITACDELLADKLATQQWWEEDRTDDGFFSISGQKAFCYFHRADGQVVGLWKNAKASLSTDEGLHWLPVSDLSTFRTGAQKMWAQRTADGRYAMVYTPALQERYPLALVSGDDGIHFNDLLCVHGEVPPMRYSGFCKDRGPQYVRGIAEPNGQAETDALWLTYSMNKEDIYVSQIPLPIRSKQETPVSDSFDDLEPGPYVHGWNILSGQWSPVAVVREEGTSNQCLELRDRDPYNHASALRVFPQTPRASLAFKVKAAQNEWGWMEIEVLDEASQVALRLILDNRGWLQAPLQKQRQNVRQYAADRWYELGIELDCSQDVYSLWIDGKPVVQNEPLLEHVKSVERICFRTGESFGVPAPQPVQLAARPDLPHGGIPVKEAVYWLDDVRLASY
jgi:hypothetical protein